jgi:hypothetical protein
VTIPPTPPRSPLNKPSMWISPFVSAILECRGVAGLSGTTNCNRCYPDKYHNCQVVPPVGLSGQIFA